MNAKEISEDEIERITDEMNLASNRAIRIFFVVAGTLCVGLGILGIILPLLPTTPLFLLAAALYARGSKRSYIWLLTNKYFGEYIRDWRNNKGIPYRTKWWITSVLILTLGITAYFAGPIIYVQLILASVAIGVSWYIWRLPTKEPVANKA